MEDYVRRMIILKTAPQKIPFFDIKRFPEPSSPNNRSDAVRSLHCYSRPMLNHFVGSKTLFFISEQKRSLEENKTWVESIRIDCSSRKNTGQYSLVLIFTQSILVKKILSP